MVRRLQSPKQTAFLAVYGKTGLIGKSARLAGCSRFSHRRWLANDPKYPAKFSEARSAACETLEAEAHRRAVAGTMKMKFWKGKPIMDPRTGLPYVEHTFSDRLLELILKANMPRKYADRPEIASSSTVPLVYDPDELDLMRAMAQAVLESRGKAKLVAR